MNFILFKQNSIEKKVLRFFCKILNSIFLSIILYQLFISNSRAGWLAFIVSFIYIVLYAVKNRISKTLSPWMKRCSIIIFIAVSFLFITHLYVLKKDSSDGRLLIWKVSLEMILDRPFAGYGLNGFKENYMLYQSKYFQKNIEDKYAILAGNNLYPFNEFIHLIIKFGIFIILLLGSSIYFLFFYQNKIMNTEMRIFRSIILAWIIFSCFSYPNQFIHFSFIFIFIVARIAVNHPNIGSVSICNCISFVKNSYCAACLYVLCGVISIYSADIYWKNINILEDVLVKKDDVFTLEKCEVLYPFFKNDDYFLFQYGTSLIKNEKYEQAIKILEQASTLCPNYLTNILLGGAHEKCTNIKRMKEYWEEAHYMIPSKFQPLYGLMNAYIKIGNLSQAQFYATLIVDKEEKIISPLSYRMKKEAQIILNEIN